MYGIRYILEPKKILYFSSVESNWIKYSNDIRDACSFDTRDEALNMIDLLKNSYCDFLNAEVFHFELSNI